MQKTNFWSLKHPEQERQDHIEKEKLHQNKKNNQYLSDDDYNEGIEFDSDSEPEIMEQSEDLLLIHSDLSEIQAACIKKTNN